MSGSSISCWGRKGNRANPALVEKWLAHLQNVAQACCRTARSSTQRSSRRPEKTRGAAAALAEERDIILLDEWAADQDAFPPQGSTSACADAGDGQNYLCHQPRRSLLRIHADRLLEMRDGKLSELTGEEREAASRDAVARTAEAFTLTLSQGRDKSCMLCRFSPSRPLFILIYISPRFKPT